VGPETGERVVAGLPLLLRAALSLQEAGVKELFLLGVPAGRLSSDPRIRLAIRGSDPPPGVAALVVAADTCCSPGVLRELVRAELRPDEVRGMGNRQACVRAAGGTALPALLTALCRGYEVSPASFEPAVAPDFVVSVVDEAGRRNAERLLLATLRKPTDGFTARHLNRAISLPLSAALCRTGVTPTQVTLFALGLGLASVVPLLTGGRTGFILAALLLQAHSVLDGCDGELARLLHLRSRVGAWADQVSDDVVNLAFLIAAGVWLDAVGFELAAPLTFIAAASFVIYQVALYAALWTRGGKSGSVTSLRWWGQGDSGSGRFRIRVPGRLRTFVEDLLRRDSYTFAYLPCALLGVPVVAFLWQVVVAVISGVVTSLQWVVAGGPQPADLPG
jgi:phosphatidylglycerophosphate synthase